MHVRLTHACMHVLQPDQGQDLRFFTSAITAQVAAAGAAAQGGEPAQQHAAVGLAPHHTTRGPAPYRAAKHYGTYDEQGKLSQRRAAQLLLSPFAVYQCRQTVMHVPYASALEI